jgi:hypothetical protein
MMSNDYAFASCQNHFFIENDQKLWRSSEFSLALRSKCLAKLEIDKRGKSLLKIIIQRYLINIESRRRADGIQYRFVLGIVGTLFTEGRNDDKTPITNGRYLLNVSPAQNES